MGVVGRWTLVSWMLAGLLLQASVFAQQTYYVADDYGWTFPPNALATFFNDWALRHNFFQGDSLKFVYPEGFHSVLEVSQADLASCSTGNPINTYTASNESVALMRTGYFGFICGEPSHCEGNMKLELTVLAVGTPVPSPGTAPATGEPSVSTPVISGPGGAPLAPPGNHASRALPSLSSFVVTSIGAMLAVVGGVYQFL